MFGFFSIKNEPKIITLVRCGILAVFAIVLLVLGGIGWYRVHQKPIDLSETHKDWNQLHAGQHVEMDVDILIGQYMYTSDNGTEISRDYLMPHVVYDSNNDYYTIDRLLGVKINNTYFDTADTIVDNTVAWWRDRSDNIEYNTVTIHIDGYLQKMNNDQLKYAKEAMAHAGFTPHDIASMLVPYYISDNASFGGTLLIIGGILAVYTAGLTFYALKKKN